MTELEYALNKVGYKVLVSMTTYKTSDYLGMVRELAPELRGVRPGQLDAIRAPQLKTVVHLGRETISGMLTFGQLMEKGNLDDPALREAVQSLKASDAINIPVQPAHRHHGRLALPA